jgi:hypothetical protein
MGVVTGAQGVISIDDYNPPPLGVDSKRLSKQLSAIAKVPHREAFVLSSRLYAQALQLLGTAPQIAYQLLISAIETMANCALSTYKPTNAEMIAIKRNVVKKAVSFGLKCAQAEELAILACSDNQWISRRFRKFIATLVDDSLWTPDTLFKIPMEFVPPKEKLEEILKKIYSRRGEAVHAGLSWQETIHFGWGPTIPVEALRHLFMGEDTDPPLVWFERVVNLALNRYLDPDARAKLPSSSVASS